MTMPDPWVLLPESGSDWQRLVLGADGRKHLKDRVGVAEQTPGLPLSTALRGLPLDEGEVWTWAPAGTTVTQRELQGGLPKMMTQKGEYAHLVQFIVKYLEPGGRLALIEDGESPSAEWLTKTPDLPSRVACENRLYWPIQLPDPRAVFDSLRWGLGLFSCTVLTPVPLPEQHQPGQLTLPQIQALAGKAEHVIVDAFDFEGFIVWDRP